MTAVSNTNPFAEDALFEEAGRQELAAFARAWPPGLADLSLKQVCLEAKGPREEAPYSRFAGWRGRGTLEAAGNGGASKPCSHSSL